MRSALHLGCALGMCHVNEDLPAPCAWDLPCAVTGPRVQHKSRGYRIGRKLLEHDGVYLYFSYTFGGLAYLYFIMTLYSTEIHKSQDNRDA